MLILILLGLNINWDIGQFSAPVADVILISFSSFFLLIKNIAHATNSIKSKTDSWIA